MDPQFSPDRPESALSRFDILTSRAGALLQRMEMGLRSSDSEIYRQVATDIISTRESFSLVAPRAIELLTEPNPRLCMRAADLLLARPHWIGSRELNEMLIPCLSHEIANPEGFVPIREMLFGLTPTASVVGDPHVRRYFGMAQAATIGSMNAGRDLAMLSLFAERIPERSYQRVLSSLAEVVDLMGQAVAFGAGPDDLPFELAADLCGATGTGLLLLRKQINEKIDRNAEEPNLETYLVRLMERYISEFATRVEHGDLPNRFEQYQLLLAYPLIVEQNIDITTEQNLNLIMKQISVPCPKIAEMLYRVRDPQLRVPSLGLLIEAPASYSAVRELQLMTSLLLITRQYQNGAGGGAVSMAGALQTQEQLERLQDRLLLPIIFPLYAECVQAVDRFLGG